MKILSIVLSSFIGAVSSYAQNTPWPASGSVGIGTMNPTSALEVNGTITANGLISFIAKAPQGYWGFNHGNFYAGQSGNVYNVGFSSGAIGIFNGSTTGEDIFLFNRNNPAGGYIVLKANNNVGIGTSAPGYALEVAKVSQNIITAFHDTGLSGIGGSGIAFLNDYTQSNSRNWALVQGRTSYGDLAFMQSNALGGNPVTDGTERVYLAASGNVGIGTTSPTEKLSVNGKIRAKEVVVETTNWSDCVFAKDYKLAPLSEVEQHIEQQGHLPGVPSAKEVAANGVSVGNMQAILLGKIEELTLHVIAQEKRVQTLESENVRLQQKLIEKEGQK
ncbi:MAG: hypothetical protein QM715_08280 [Nibricoccus sp.]